MKFNGTEGSSDTIAEIEILTFKCSMLQKVPPVPLTNFLSMVLEEHSLPLVFFVN